MRFEVKKNSVTMTPETQAESLLLERLALVVPCMPSRGTLGSSLILQADELDASTPAVSNLTAKD